MEDLGRRLWAAYLDRHFKPERIPPEIEMVGAEGVEKLIFSYLPVFRPVKAALDAVPFDEAHDSEADQALEWLALDGTTTRWSELSAGAWRVLFDRLSFALFALEMKQRTGEAFTIPLPRHASETQRAAAAVLCVLGTFARTIPAEWPGRSAHSSPGNRPTAPSTRH